MLKTPFTRFRLTTFPDLSTANASNVLFGYGDVICIIGDNTRFKLGMGLINSAKNPAVPTAVTFANLPWINSNAASGNTPVTTFALNATGAISAANLLKKYITSTSAAPVTGTLDTAANIGAAVGAAQGTEVPFTVDNSAGANVFTVAVAAGLVVAPASIGLLTVPAGAIAKFNIVFKSATTAVIYRVTVLEAATVAAVTDNSGGVSGGNTIAVLVDAGGTAAGAPTTASVANALATIAAKQNAILAALKAANLMA